MRDQGSDDQVFYWLGLNRLAVGEWGTESGHDTAAVRTNGTTPTDVTFNITPLAGSPYTNGDNIVVPVGTHYMDGEWHYVEQDLLGIFEDLRPTWDFVQFDAMIVYAEDAYIDDIVLSGGSMARSYQVVPGAALGGTLAVQTGADGGEGVGAWETAYYHYNDLGTVLATTDDAGDTIGAWVPDFNGNYTNGYLGGYKYTGSPDRPEIGLTGKWFDDAAGLYYFNARWLDSERARWMSEEPLGLDGPNLYHFGFGKIVNGIDSNGLHWMDNWGRWGRNFWSFLHRDRRELLDIEGMRHELPEDEFSKWMDELYEDYYDEFDEWRRKGGRGGGSNCVGAVGIGLVIGIAVNRTIASYTALYNAEADLLDQDLYDEKWNYCNAKCNKEVKDIWMGLSKDTIIELNLTKKSFYDPCMEECMSRPWVGGI